MTCTLKQTSVRPIRTGTLSIFVMQPVYGCTQYDDLPDTPKIVVLPQYSQLHSFHKLLYILLPYASPEMLNGYPSFG
jgi:hypothetical protein